MSFDMQTSDMQRIIEKSGRGGTRHSQDSLVLEIAVYFLLTFTPMALGGVHFWVVVVMFGVSFGAFVVLLKRIQRNKKQLYLFPFGSVLLLVTCFTALQCVPLPTWLIEFINPGAGAVYSKVFAEQHQTAWRPNSLSVPFTAIELLKHMVYFMLFVTIVNYFNNRTRTRRLLKAIAWSGFSIALIGFFSKLFMAQSILGFYPVKAGAFFFSTFVNPNHMAGFLLMCSPVALGLSLSARDRQDKVLFGFLSVIMGVAVFMSMSRGGMVAYVVAMTLMAMFAGTRKSHRFQRVALVQAVLAVMLIVAGYLAFDTITKELRTLGDLGAVREATKIQSWSAVGALIGEHPLMGVGRGAYITTYPRFKDLSVQSTFTHAENQTLQFLADWGVIVGGLFVLSILVCFWFGLSRSKQSISMAGCLVGVFGAFLHNQVDYNLEIAGVMVMFVTLMSVMAALPFSHARQPGKLEFRFRMPGRLAWLLPVAALIMAIWACPIAARYDYYALTPSLLELQNEPPAEPCDKSPLGRLVCDVMDKHPADYLAPLILGRSYMQSEKPDLGRAVHWLSVAMFLNPTEPTGHHLAGRALLFGGFTDQALSEYRLAITYAKGLQSVIVSEILKLTSNPELAIRVTPPEALARYKTARLLLSLGHKKAARRACRLALDQDSSLMVAYDLFVEMTMADNKLTQALVLAQRSIEIEPEREKAWVLLGDVYHQRQALDKAENTWKEGLEHVPDSVYLASRLISLLLRKKSYSEAQMVALRVQAYAHSGDDKQAWLAWIFGRIKEARLMHYEARKHYLLATVLSPQNLHYLHSLGRVEEKLGFWDAAERIYSRLLESNYRRDEIRGRIKSLRQKTKDTKRELLLNRQP
jgi:tetratricopeptide (TPR) repeat protein